MKKALLIFLLLFLPAAVLPLAGFADTPPAKKTVVVNDNYLYSDEQISVSNIYPNPAVDHVSFDYSLRAQVSAKIVIRNVLGSALGTYRLEAGRSKLKIDTGSFVSGIYFFTLSVNNKNVTTKKFLVKK